MNEQFVAIKSNCIQRHFGFEVDCNALHFYEMVVNTMKVERKDQNDATDEDLSDFTQLFLDPQKALHFIRCSTLIDQSHM